MRDVASRAQPLIKNNMTIDERVKEFKKGMMTGEFVIDENYFRTALTETRNEALEYVREVAKSMEVCAVGSKGEYEFRLDKIQFPDGTLKYKTPGYEEIYNQALTDLLTKLDKDV